MSRTRIPQDIVMRLENENINALARELREIFGQEALSKRHLYRLKRNPTRGMVNSKTLDQLVTYYRDFKDPRGLRFIALIRSKEPRVGFLYEHLFRGDFKTYQKTLLSIYRLISEQGLTVNQLVLRCEEIATGRKRRKPKPSAELLHQLFVRGLTRKRVSKKINWFEEALIGRYVPTLAELKIISKALRVDVGDIFSPSERALEAFQEALRESAKDKPLNQALNELRTLLGLHW